MNAKTTETRTAIYAREPWRPGKPTEPTEPIRAADASGYVWEWVPAFYVGRGRRGGAFLLGHVRTAGQRGTVPERVAGAVTVNGVDYYGSADVEWDPLRREYVVQSRAFQWDRVASTKEITTAAHAAIHARLTAAAPHVFPEPTAADIRAAAEREAAEIIRAKLGTAAHETGGDVRGNLRDVPGVEVDSPEFRAMVADAWRETAAGLADRLLW